MTFLLGVLGRDLGRVLGLNRRRRRRRSGRDQLSDILHSRFGIKQLSALHLMKDWVMAGIDLISSVDISRDQDLVGLCQDLELMGRGMGSEHDRFIQVIGIRDSPSWMVCGKAQIIKVLLGRYDGRELIVMLKVGKSGCDQFLDDGDGVSGDKVELAGGFFQDGGRDIGGRVLVVGLASDYNLLGGDLRWGLERVG